LPHNEEVDELATEYIKGGVLSEKCIDDCLHIAYAVNRYKEISIVSPTMLIEEE